MTDSNNETYVIAEAGVNHNGSYDLAIELIDIAYEAGANAVKFQTFKASKLVSKKAKKANYQIVNTNNEQESQFEMLKKLEISYEETTRLKEYCDNKGITFLSTPFDFESVDFLDSINVNLFKIGSGEITNAPLILKIAQKKKKIILSTGMSDLSDIKLALGVIAYGLMDWTSEKTIQIFSDAYFEASTNGILCRYVSLLHCTTEYPCPLRDVNLLAMKTMRDSFGLEVGYSDHTEGIQVAALAVAAGARVIEKHFTIDKSMSGPDHKASLNPIELKEMISLIRETKIVLGEPDKVCSESEEKNQGIARKSLVASTMIKVGDELSKENITIKRPGTGVAPVHYWSYIGQKADREYFEDDLFD